MRNLFIIVAILLISYNRCYSQEPKNSGTLGVYIAPLSLIDFKPRYRVGAEYSHNNKWVYSLDFGLGNYQMNYYRLKKFLHINKYGLFEIRPQVKFQFRNAKHNKLYFALEGFFVDYRFSVKDLFYIDYPTNTKINFETADYHKIKTGYLIIFGEKRVFFNRLFYDFYIGLGIAHRYLDYYNIVNPTLNIEDEDRLFNVFDDTYESCKYVANMALGIKVGYKFNL